MTYDEIMNHNKKILSKCNLLNDMNTFFITKDEIYKEITKIKMTKQYYNKNKIINDKLLYKILSNRNLSNINLNIKKGITINRSNLRLLPTNIQFYDKKNDNIFDRLQETALNIGTTLYILHISLDKKWYFVKSYFAYGWIHKNDFIFVDDNKFNYFENNNNFIIITEPLLKIKNKYLDMGTKLPYIKTKNNKTKVLLPNNKYLWIKNKYISKKYLDYNYDNLIKLTNKYIGVNYGWGGLNNGVDCTSLVCNIFKCFGFIFPRNTKEQREIVGIKTINIQKYNKKEKIRLLNKIGLLYTTDHCLIFLGNDKVVHAQSNAKKVIKSNLNNIDGIDFYNKIIYYNIIEVE